MSKPIDLVNWTMNVSQHRLNSLDLMGQFTSPYVFDASSSLFRSQKDFSWIPKMQMLKFESEANPKHRKTC